MRFTRIVKAPLKAAALAALFGVVIGLTLPAEAQSPGPIADDQRNPNEVCGDNQSQCDDIQFQGTLAGCPAYITCFSFSTNACYTCRPGGTEVCINSDSRFGHITCPGLCNNLTSSPCRFIVYACKN